MDTLKVIREHTSALLDTHWHPAYSRISQFLEHYGAVPGTSGAICSELQETASACSYVITQLYNTH